MKFAINYSPQAEQLLQAGKIQVDVFKCPSWDDLVPRVHRSHPAYVHFSFLAGRNQLDTVDLDWVDNWLKTTDTLVINTHLATCEDDFAKGEPVTPDAVIEKVVQDVEFFGKRFGNERVVVENIPYPDPGWNDGLLKETVDPAVISQVVEQTGCGLLLDVAHAIRACEGLGKTDIKGYLNAMPVHALRELHVVGILAEKDADGVRQDHYELLDSDWEMVEWSIAQIRDGKWNKPDVMAFEYGGIGPLFESRSKLSVIAEQVPRLYQLAQLD
jgi:uncharacterized protein